MLPFATPNLVPKYRILCGSKSQARCRQSSRLPLGHELIIIIIPPTISLGNVVEAREIQGRIVLAPRCGYTRGSRGHEIPCSGPEAHMDPTVCSPAVSFPRGTPSIVVETCCVGYKNHLSSPPYPRNHGTGLQLRSYSKSF
jgi:hypothetical protein